MDKLHAQNIIKQAFENPFDKERFINFIRNFLNRIEDAPFIYRGNYIPDAFEQHISSLERIGKYSDGEHKIDILIIHLKKEASIERARTMQRNFIAWYLNGSRGGELKDAALVAFVSPDETDWRFSLVKMDYKFEQTPTGRMKVKEEFTPARRWSFLVGANEKSHTAQSRLANILANDEQSPTLAELEKAFDIETVTKEFFIKYRDLFIRTKEELDRAVKNSDKIRADFESKGVNTVDFAKKLLGQIVFLYFLQKKGWFGVGRDADWGTGSKQFLRELFEKKHGEYNNFFNDVLEHLFYDALRDDRNFNDYYYSRFNCKIPFLNGGLFDPIGNYDWVHTDILLPDSLLSNNNRTREGDEGDGILDVFDRYNFTVKEDEPLEKEVAIDPELLGKAYEKFNAIRPDNFEEYKKALKSGKKGEESKFNKQYGVYYTPREIVHYMCQQSLINYLQTELKGSATAYEKFGEEQLDMLGNKAKTGQLDLTIEHTAGPAISKEDIERLIHYGEQVRENEIRVESKGKETRTYSYKLPESIRKNAGLIDKKLADIMVCDPAVGSGAFPVGMMSEIVKARTVLSTFIEDKENRTPYDFKRQCIEYSLYGVDIDPGAVEIAKLRLWLSVVVDEEDIKNIKPLPNLDYKIVCGNSLIGVEKDLFNNQLFTELETLKLLYFNETNPTQKQEYKKQINGLIREITNGHKEFDFAVYFSEVFHNRGGFDVVIANPPYGAVLLEEQKKYLKKRHEHIIERIRNTFLYFLGEAYNQSRKKGVVCFILPNELLFQIYMTKARKFFLEKSQVLFAINLGEDIFEAIVPTCVICLMKVQQNDYTIPVADLREATLEELPKLLVTENFPVTTNRKILSAPNSIFSFDKNIAELINRLASSFQPFETFCDDVANGISTSCDEAYIVSEKFAKENHFEKDYLKECIRGGQFNRFYCLTHTHEYVLYITDEFDRKIGKNIYQYLSKNKELLVQKSVEKKQGKREWHVLFRSRYEGLYRKPKILFRQTGDEIIAAVDRETGYYCINSVHIGLVKPEYYDLLDYLVGLLNSKLITFYYREISQEKGRVLAEVKPQRIRSLPISMGTLQQREQITKLANRILAAKRIDLQANTSMWEREIDQMVYQLYGLTPQEIRLVEKDRL